MIDAVIDVVNIVPNWNFFYILDSVISVLKECGLTSNQI